MVRPASGPRSPRAERSERPERPERARSSFRPAVVARDPFFDKPYEAPQSEAAPGWEASARPARSGASPNIKPRRKVAALFKAPAPEAAQAQDA